MSAGDVGRPASSSPLPAQIGRYRVVERIGKGAMGVVYRARDEQLDRFVAVKVLMTDFAEEPDVRARFYREAQSAGRLLHRNIITIFDLGDDHGKAYIVMELLSGSTLSDYMGRPEAAELEPKIDLMMQVCDGLGAAHAAGIIHRDIKPGNLFVLNDGGLKILDFGVARLVTSSMTVQGHIIGTPSYMSPEQATGRQIDHRSDIFSAGGVFYWMLTGRKPFAAPDLPTVLRKVQLEDPPALRDEEAPAPLARIVVRALAKDPALRYQRIGDMLGDLQRFRRQFEADSLRLGALAQGHVQAIRELEDETSRLRARLGLEAPEQADPFARLRSHYPILAERGLSSLGALAFSHAVTTKVARDLERLRTVVETDVAALRTAAEAAEEETARAAAAAIQAARDLFADCRRPEAVELLEDFLAQHPDVTAIQEEIARLRHESAAAAEEEHRAAEKLATEKAAAGEMSAAREIFQSGRRDEAIARLAAYTAANPAAPGVEEEAERLRREAARIDQQERRQAEIASCCARAADAITRQAFDAAIAAAQEALDLEPSHPGALRLRDEARLGQRASAEAAALRTKVAELLEQARFALDSGALDRAVRHCRSINDLEPGNRDAAGLQLEAELRASRLRQALAQAREARRLERAAGYRLIVARVAIRLGRFRQAYDAASACLALLPGSGQAAAIRAAAASALGIGTWVDDDDTVAGSDGLSPGEPTAVSRETRGTDTGNSGRPLD